MMRIACAATLAMALVLTAVEVIAQTNEPELIDNLFGYQVCHHTEYALCAASTCTPTGGKIKVNKAQGGTGEFDEAACTCPIFEGPAIADVNGGNMKGSCNPPGPGQVWSLYWPKQHIPQAISNWSTDPEDDFVEMQLCSDSDKVGKLFANCFSFACTVNPEPINGVKVATCFCPLGEDLEGNVVKKNTPVLTPAGQCNEDICFQYPVGAPDPNAAGQPNKCYASR